MSDAENMFQPAQADKKGPMVRLRSWFFTGLLVTAPVLLTIYITWLFIGEGLAVLYILLPRMQRLKAQPNRQLMLAFGGGLLSALAYALALYAKTKAPLGLVSALRETSVIFAAMIGVFWFGEGPVRTRLCAAAVVVMGIILLALA